MAMRRLSWLLLPLSILAFFVFSNGWYLPTELVIQGRVPSGKGQLEVAWDGGAGYNKYERLVFSLDTRSVREDGRHAIEIRSTERKNSASLSSQVVCSRVTIDDKDLELEKHPLFADHPDSGPGLYLTHPAGIFALEAMASEHVFIELQTNNHSGRVEVQVDNKVHEFDLYVANIEAKSIQLKYWLVDGENQFRVIAPLPRYGLEALKVSNLDEHQSVVVEGVLLRTEASEYPLLADEANLSSGVPLIYSRPTDRFRVYFAKHQFLLQVLFSLLLSWMIAAVAAKVKAVGGCRELFRGKRRFFWSCCLASGVIYTSWLFIFWPGVMSVDSLKVWRAASLPEVFLNDHPLLNVLLYMFLAQIWNNVAVVPVCHIVLLSLLSSSVFYTLHKEGVGLGWLIPCFVFLLGSLPVALYNLTLWKDIPFALLIVFWGFTLALFYQKRCLGTLRFTLESGMAYFLLYLALALVRHNGAAYLVVVPVYFLVLRLVPVRTFLTLALGGILVVAVTITTISYALKIGDAGYLLRQGSRFMVSFFQEPLGSAIMRTWHHYWGILDINQTVSKWDLWHYFLRDRVAYSFLQHAGWNDIYPYLAPPAAPLISLRNAAMDLYWHSYQLPWVYLSWNPVVMLGIYLGSIVTFRITPRTAIFSSFVLTQVFCLLFFINILNWRYYYFVFLGGYFLLPFIFWDLARLRSNRKGLVLSP
ncbi:hypothetical protein [Desulfogranum mediterraneum]|uniref:hypothetical protein n=1 Tax=Desulfogranum mediterraneum TaxID=160661 RepID=UPI00042161FF|nr:hypothetical protein [Desulfogranum mediterraneum]